MKSPNDSTYPPRTPLWNPHGIRHVFPWLTSSKTGDSIDRIAGIPRKKPKPQNWISPKMWTFQSSWLNFLSDDSPWSPWSPNMFKRLWSSNKYSHVWFPFDYQLQYIIPVFRLMCRYQWSMYTIIHIQRIIGGEYPWWSSVPSVYRCFSIYNWIISPFS